jgi:hypothetical protein
MTIAAVGYQQDIAQAITAQGPRLSPTDMNAVSPMGLRRTEG